MYAVHITNIDNRFRALSRYMIVSEACYGASDNPMIAVEIPDEGVCLYPYGTNSVCFYVSPDDGEEYGFEIDSIPLDDYRSIDCGELFPRAERTYFGDPEGTQLAEWLQHPHEVSRVQQYRAELRGDMSGQGASVHLSSSQLWSAGQTFTTATVAGPYPNETVGIDIGSEWQANASERYAAFLREARRTVGTSD